MCRKEGMMGCDATDAKRVVGVSCDGCYLHDH
jgi:hypothetical protein